MISSDFSILDLHADDYGISRNSCDDILKLCKEKKIQSISILPNMETFSYAAAQLHNFMTDGRKLEVTVHLNFMEGHCVAEKKLIPDLVEDGGFFNLSWGKLIKANYNPFKRNRIKKQLTIETVSQIRKCITAGIIDKENIRIDGHQHPHMIPVVVEAIMDAVSILEKEGCKLTYFRNTEDPLFFYLKHLDMIHTASLINIIKCLILNHYSHNVKKIVKKKDIQANYLCGVFYSGHMDTRNLLKILPEYISIAKKQGRRIEVLFHPGHVLEAEITKEFVKPDFNLFHLSEDRILEFNSAMQLSE